MPDYNYKIYNFINPCLQKFKDISILELELKREDQLNFSDF